MIIIIIVNRRKIVHSDIETLLWYDIYIYIYNCIYRQDIVIGHIIVSVYVYIYIT